MEFWLKLKVIHYDHRNRVFTRAIVSPAEIYIESVNSVFFWVIFNLVNPRFLLPPLVLNAIVPFDYAFPRDSGYLQ
jgi:hypothetical protein